VAVLGVSLRRRRIVGRDGRAFLLALDHGLAAGPIDGIRDPTALLRELRDAPLTGIVANPGMVPHIASELRVGQALVVHLSAGTLLGSQPRSKVASCSVADAVALGADAVSVQLPFGDPAEDRMLATAGEIVADARSFGLPTLVMVYQPSADGGVGDDIDRARHANRAAAEIGADVVQANYFGPTESFPELVAACPVPLIFAGGPRSASTDDFLRRLRSAIAAGAAGITVGRNVFQQPNPRGVAMRIGEAVFGAPSARETSEVLHETRPP
jgi:DhnA family fructose-bisphosphate aldolase class Ia